MTPTIVVTLVLTMMTAGQQYERNMPMDSMGQCLSEATKILNQAAKGQVETKTDAAGNWRWMCDQDRSGAPRIESNAPPQPPAGKHLARDLPR
jgi:hypothetical protein